MGSSRIVNKLEWLPIDKVFSSYKNPRTISEEDLTRLKTSIEEDPQFLERRPILVALMNGRYMVYAGTQRLQALKQLGYTEVPAFVSEGLDQRTFDSRMIKDNVHYGEWDFSTSMDEFSADIQLVTELETENSTEKRTRNNEERRTPSKLYRVRIPFATEEDYMCMLGQLAKLNMEHPEVPTVGERLLIKLRRLL